MKNHRFDPETKDNAAIAEATSPENATATEETAAETSDEGAE